MCALVSRVSRLYVFSVVEQDDPKCASPAQPGDLNPVVRQVPQAPGIGPKGCGSSPSLATAGGSLSCECRASCSRICKVVLPLFIGFKAKSSTPENRFAILGWVSRKKDETRRAEEHDQPRYRFGNIQFGLGPRGSGAPQRRPWAVQRLEPGGVVCCFFPHRNGCVCSPDC